MSLPLSRRGAMQRFTSRVDHHSEQYSIYSVVLLLVRSTDGRMDGRTGGRLHGRASGRADGRADGSTEGCEERVRQSQRMNKEWHQWSLFRTDVGCVAAAAAAAPMCCCCCSCFDGVVVAESSRTVVSTSPFREQQWVCVRGCMCVLSICAHNRTSPTG